MYRGVVPGMVALSATPPVPWLTRTGARLAGTGAGPVTDIAIEKPARPWFAAAVVLTHGWW